MPDNDPALTEKVSFHNHTTFSDGADTDVALLKKAFASDITDLAITDHDTHEGLSPNNLEKLVRESFLISHVTHEGLQVPITVEQHYQREYDSGVYVFELGGKKMHVYRGVEYTVRHKDLLGNITQRHLIGLGMRFPEREELRRCVEIKSQRKMRIGTLIAEINRLNEQGDEKYAGIKIDPGDLSGVIDPETTTPSRLHIGYLISRMFEAKGIRKTPRQANKEFVGEWLVGYNLPSGVTPWLVEGIRIIHQLGGIAILPHIHRNGLGNEEGYTESIYEMVRKYRLDGFEIQVGGYNECVPSQRNIVIASDLNSRHYPKLDLTLGDNGLSKDHPPVLVSLGVDFHGAMNDPEKADYIEGTHFPHDYRDGRGLLDLKERMNFRREMLKQPPHL